LSLPAFGASGPWADYVAFGSGLELATSLASVGASGAPVVAAVPYLDYLSGCYGAVGVLAALFARDRHQTGVHLEVAQREVACQLARPAADGGSSGPTFDVSAKEISADRCLADRGLIARRPAAASGCFHLARAPFRFHGIPPTRERGAPGLGSDSRRILRRVGGLSNERIDDLVTAGVVHGAPPLELAR
jgi:crotonobetainyl-CoA:carnitine CoA-transferase CaiB-like acyl-CoA transferase